MLKPEMMEPGEVQNLLGQCSFLYTSGSNFLKELRADPSFRLSRPTNLVCVLQIRHQIEALDAAVSVALAGRPHFLKSLGRPVYETYLNTLGIGWLDEQVGKVKYRPAYNARRFLAVRNFTYLKLDRNVERLSDPWVRLGMDRAEAEKRRRLLLRWAAPASKRYVHLNEKSNSWFHLGVSRLHEHLWPVGGKPHFPPQLFNLPDGRREWERLHGTFWGHDSNQVHASITGLESRLDDSRDSWPSWDPVYEFITLNSLSTLISLSLFAGADSIGKLPAFNQIWGALESNPPVNRIYESGNGTVRAGWRP